MDETPTNQILRGDSLDILDDLPANSVHAIVTDPPYGLAFMGRDWDDFEPKEYQEWCENWSRRAKRVLKPGGHLLAFSGNRTHHRLFTGVEDAGFEIRDTVTWHYGSGFPKASDVSKTIDKRAGEYENREKVGERDIPADIPQQSPRDNDNVTKTNTASDSYEKEGGLDITRPATDEAKEWDGWRTGLKPATEFVVMARKPFDGATVDSVLTNGTGALNIPECRIEYNGEVTRIKRESDGQEYTDNPGQWQERGRSSNRPSTPTEKGRYPSNVVFDAAAADALDRDVGELSGGARTPQTQTGRNSSDAPTNNDPAERIQLESGGPSRYFYTSKATKAERTLDGKIENAHPTVKPTDLMEWMVKLVTVEGQLVLDLFAGSGTTCAAAKSLGRDFIGIEKQAKWADVARVRCGLTPSDPANVRADDSQSGLEAFADGGFVE